MVSRETMANTRSQKRGRLNLISDDVDAGRLRSCREGRWAKDFVASKVSLAGTEFSHQTGYPWVFFAQPGDTEAELFS
jgi:hypothetical protein